MADSKMIAVENLPWGFQKGWGQVMQKDAEMVKGKIMAALHIISTPSWHARLNGKVEPKHTEREAIEKVFAEYAQKRKITIKQIWGK